MHSSVYLGAPCGPRWLIVADACAACEFSRSEPRGFRESMLAVCIGGTACRIGKRTTREDEDVGDVDVLCERRKRKGTG